MTEDGAVRLRRTGSLRVSLRYSLFVVPQGWGTRGLKEIALQTPSPFQSPPVRARRAVPQPLPAGAYFVTICTRERGCLLGQVVDGEMRLNPLGEIAAACRHAVPHHFPRVVLDQAITMPNHIHGIIVIHGRGETSAVSLHVSEERPESDASPRRPCSP
jgi:hypothetical protein